MMITFKNKISLFVFSTVFISFLVFILLENALWLENILQKGELTLPVTLGRFFIAISFSMLVGLSTYLLANKFHTSIQYLSNLIKSSVENIHTKEIKSKVPKNEIGEIIQTFKNSYLQNKEQEDLIVQNVITMNNLQIMENIQELLFNINLTTIKNLDISVLPNKSQNPLCDYINVIETSNGCITLMAGFPDANIVHSSYKFRIQGIVSMVENISHLPEPEILKYIDKSIRKVKIEGLNLSVIFTANNSDTITYINYQQNPFYKITKSNIDLLMNHNKPHFDFELSESKYLSAQLKTSSYLVLISDRILKPLRLTEDTLFTELEKEILSKYQYTNSKELLVQIGKHIETLGRNRKQTNILDYMSILVQNKNP
ncbi:MAG: hypothetical protein KDK90_20955 [Leptospiraceae bacterium]|nr:hypothetical protein [Leptospiraceae bacterium]